MTDVKIPPSNYMAEVHNMVGTHRSSIQANSIRKDGTISSIDFSSMPSKRYECDSLKNDPEIKEGFENRVQQFQDLDPTLTISQLMKQEQQMMRQKYGDCTKDKTSILEKVSEIIIISPSSYFYQGWKISVIILSFVSSFIYAFKVNYMNKYMNEDANFGTGLIEIFFILDMLLQFALDSPS